VEIIKVSRGNQVFELYKAKSTWSKSTTAKPSPCKFSPLTT